MTYCVGMYLQDGLLFASDSRTNAGVDYITSYSKMYVFTPAPDRMFVMLSAGNLAITQEIIHRIQRDLDYPDDGENFLSARYLFEAADYVARISLEVQNKHYTALQQAGVSGEVTLILGGQIEGQPHGLMMIYPQGNYIEASDKTPYLQIGETKYGKPVLDRLVHYELSLNDAARLALVSLTSTANSNITVGPPFELSTYQTDQYQLSGRCTFNYNGNFLDQLEESWKLGLQQAFENLPSFEWELRPQSDQQMSFNECEFYQGQKSYQKQSG